MKNVLNLPEELKARREVLESELRKVVVELCFTGLKEDLNKLFEKFGVNSVTSVDWEFYGEYDDEGGTDWCPSSITLNTEEGILSMDDVNPIKVKSRYSDEYYNQYFADSVYDIMYNYKKDLYEHDITEIEL